jgi:Yip1 domain
MSTVNTLTGIFLEPGRTFKALRERPRFLVAAVIIISALALFNFVAIERVGYENVVRTSIEANPRLAGVSDNQKEELVQSQSSGYFKVLNYSTPVLIFVVSLIIGSAFYLVGTLSAGDSLSYHQSLSVWTYSGLPPTVLLMIANVIVLFLKSPDQIEFGSSDSGLVHANLGMLVNAKSFPILKTALASIDLFAFYGLFLAVLGIRKMTQLTAFTASLIVLVVWAIFVGLRVGGALLLGTAIE